MQLTFSNPRFRILAGLAVLLTLLAGHPGASPAAVAAGEAVFTANTADDADNPDAFLSLREALLVANGSLAGGLTAQEQAQLSGCVFNAEGNIVSGCGAGNVNIVEFAASLGAGAEIRLGSPLPAISNSAATIIKGGTVRPVIVATNAGAGSDGFSIASNDNVIQSLTVIGAPRDGFSITGSRNSITDFMTRGNARNGVFINGGADNNVAQAFIGVASAGDTACSGGNGESGVYLLGAAGAVVTGTVLGCNAREGVTIEASSGSDLRGNFIGVSPASAALPNGAGVGVIGGSTGNVVGPASSDERNVISGNSGPGVGISGSGTTNNTVVGNYLGTDVAGGSARANGGAGVSITALASGNTVRGNVISGNSREGLLIENAANVTVAGNLIGTSAAGGAAVPNGLEGVVLQAGASSSTVGGTAASDRNVISGNSASGVVVRDATTTNNTVDGNFIGIDAQGIAALPNGQAGVGVFEAPSTRVGSGGSTLQQFISGNTREGVFVDAASNVQIGSNTAIGVGANGSSAIGNTREGILLNNTTGANARPGLVARNGMAGIALVGNDATGNMLIPVEVGTNGGLPVDLGNDGPTANHTGTAIGPNGFLNFPVITTRGVGTVSGTACGNCTVILYNALADPSQARGRVEYLSQVVANSAGAWSASVPGTVPTSNVAAMTCSGSCAAGSSTSEISPVSVLVQERTVQLTAGANVVAEGGTVQVFVQVTTSDGKPTTGPATVRYATSDGTAKSGADYAARTGTFSFLAGAISGETRTFSIQTFADSDDDAGETFTITLDNPTGAILGDVTTQTVTIGAPGSGLPHHAVVAFLTKD